MTVNSESQSGPECSAGESMAVELREGPTGRGVHVWMISAGLVLAAFLLYRSTLGFGYVDLDDHMYVVGNEEVRVPTWSAVRKCFAEVLHPTMVEGYYQPLAILSLMGDALLTGGDGLDPFYYHFTSVLLHALNAVLVFFLIRLAVGGRFAPVLVALLFLVHPAQVESVSWISQRKCVLAAFFSISSVIQYLKYGRTGRKGWLAACFVSMVLANLAKPTAMPLPLVLVLLDVWPLKRPVIRSLPEKLIFAPLVFLPAYVAWVSQAQSATLSAPRFGSVEMVFKWIGLLSFNLAQYLGNLVWPLHLAPYREIPADLSWSNPAIGGAVTFAFVLIVLWGISLRRWKPVFVGATAFMLMLSPAIGGVHFTASCVADRFLYIPMIFLLLPLAVLLKRMEDLKPAGRRNATAVVVALLGVLAWMTDRQQGVWGSSERLWRHVLQAAPSLPTARTNVGYFALAQRHYPKALELAESVLALDPNQVDCLLIAGKANLELGQYDAAEARLRKALASGDRKKMGYAWVDLAAVAAARDDGSEARHCFEEAMRLGCRDVEAIARAAELARTVGGNCDLSIELHRMAISIAPDDLQLLYELAQTLQVCHRTEEALATLEDFIRRARSAGIDVSAVERTAEHLKRSLRHQTP